MALEIVVKPNPELEKLVKRMEKASGNQHSQDVDDVIRRLEAERDQARAARDTWKSLMESARVERDGLQRKLEEVQNHAVRGWRQVDGCRAAVENARSELKQAQEAAWSCQKGENDAREERDEAREERDELTDKLEGIQVANVASITWEQAAEKAEAECDQARAARDTWAVLKDAAQAECDSWRGKFHGMETQRDELKVRAEETRKSRDYWQQTHAEQEKYFLTGIKDDAQRAGIDTGGMQGMAIVHAMVEEIQGCHQVRNLYHGRVGDIIRDMEQGRNYHQVCGKLRSLQDAASKAYQEQPSGKSNDSWERSYARLKRDIHHYAVALGIKPSGTCRDIVKAMAHKAETWAMKAADEACTASEMEKRAKLLDAGIRKAIGEMGSSYGHSTLFETLQQAGQPMPPDELQVRCDLLEVGIRDALVRIRKDSKEAVIDKLNGTRDTLHRALERTGLDGCCPPRLKKPNELKAKLQEALAEMTECHIGAAQGTLREALAMTDFLYHQNDPPMTDQAYQALQEAHRALDHQIPNQNEIATARSALAEALILLVEEPSAGMVRGALKQARDLLATAEHVWSTPTTSPEDLGKAMTQQYTAIREALVMLKTVLGDDD